MVENINKVDYSVTFEKEFENKFKYIDDDYNDWHIDYYSNFYILDNLVYFYYIIYIKMIFIK